jgi:tetratricopeptide (TPR) repeat protein
VNVKTLQKNLFIITSKIAHELFEVSYYDSSERLLEFAINEIDTSSLMLKMSTLSTLSACYWKQSKFSESIRCMNLEFNLVSHLNDLQNKYRILGNIANAYQLLDNNNEAKNYFKLQLSISLKMKNRVLTIHSLNSLGNLHAKCKEYDKALECFNKSLSLIQMLVTATEPSQQSFKSELLKKQLLIKQYNLVGECYMKLNDPQKSRTYFIAQLEAANDMNDEGDEEKLKNICKSKINLALIETKLNHFHESISIYEDLLNQHFLRYKFKNFELIEIYFKINLNLLNACIKYNKIQKAASYAQYLLEFSLSEQNKQKFKLLAKQSNTESTRCNVESTSSSLKYYKYLKFIELCACGKLAACFSKSNNHTDAAKLYERELKIANYLDNTIYITRSYSHLAQVYFLKKDYNKCISYYKEILNLIKTKVSNSIEINSQNNEKRLLQMTYYTLSNLGLCMEILDRLNDAYLLFIEQYEISKRLNNLKYNANALLNIINLYFKYEKNFYIQTSFVDDYTSVDTTLFNNSQQYSKSSISEKKQENKIIDNLDLKIYLYNLLDIYQELNDLNGELFISQCLAYYYHKNNLIKLAIKFYIHSIEMCKILNKKLVNPLSSTQQQQHHQLENKTDKDSIEKYMLHKKINFYSNTNTFEKSLFNLSICYRHIRKYEEAYKYQLKYLYLIRIKNYKYSEFISLGIIADLLLEMSVNYDECIKIQIIRLRLIQDNLRKYNQKKKQQEQQKNEDNEQERFKNELEYFTMKRCKLIANCLSSIAKCYFLFQDYQQVYKFKLMEFKLRIQDEQQMMINKLGMGNYSSLIRKQINKEKFKILLDLGNVLLFKLQNYNQAMHYYEYAYKICKINLSSDLILISLALGNIGICKLKTGEYELAINYFKQQIQVLSEKLKNVTPVDINKQKYNLSLLNLKEVLMHKEYILVYLDIGRSYSKLSKCYELLNVNNSAMNLFEDEALNYLIDYLKICELLYTKYSDQSIRIQQSESKTTNVENNSNDSESENSEMSHLISDVNEQIINDFDLSLYKLAKLYINKLKRTENQGDIITKLAINLHEKRLNLYLTSDVTKEINIKTLNKIIEINFIISNLYYKIENFENSYKYLSNIINIVKNKTNDQKINFILYFQALVLFFKISFKLAASNQSMIKPNFEEILNHAFQAHTHLFRLNDEKYFQLKVDVIDSIVKIYIKLGLMKACVQFLQQSISTLTELNITSSELFIKNMFKLNFKCALIHLKYDCSNDLSSIASTTDSVEIHEQSITSALDLLFTAENYLNREDYTLAKQVFELRLANLFFYKGVSYKELKNFNTSLEMFANALDLYENYDKNIEYYKEVEDDELQFEGVVKGIEGLGLRIDLLYEFIEDLLIKMDKLKEALLVTERHRSKLDKNLTRLGDLSQFDQIESVLIENNPLALVYFHLLKFNSTINCWLLEPGLGITKFHQISFKSLSSLLLLVPVSNNDKEQVNFFKHLVHLPNEVDKNLLLKQAYNMLIKPFENNLFNWFHINDLKYSIDKDCQLEDIIYKNKLFIIYDQDLFTIPFHLLKFEKTFDNKVLSFHLHEIFDCNCLYSLKYLFSSQSIGLNFKFISNEIELQKLVDYSIVRRNENGSFNKKVFYKLLILNLLNDTG